MKVSGRFQSSCFTQINVLVTGLKSTAKKVLAILSSTKANSLNSKLGYMARTALDFHCSLS